jgi:Fe-S-cluster containining protein
MPLAWPAEARAFRYTDPSLERRHPDLGLLFDAYAVVDLGVKVAIGRDGRVPVCHAGCGHCCAQPIPVTPLEVLALHCYARRRLPQDSLAGLVQRMSGYEGQKRDIASPCPFLHDGACLVYPVRPVACRQYMVFGTPCAQGEDASRSRPQDVLAPSYDHMLAALMRTLPWYAGHEPAPPEHPTEESVRAFFQSITSVVQAVAWNRFFHV